MAKLETVKVKFDNEDGFIVINKSDLTNKHILYAGKKAPVKKEKDGKKWKKE